MTNFNEEAIAKAKQAKSVEELLTLAKESGVEMTAEQSQEIFAQLNPKSGELADDELDNVAGGGCYTRDGQLIVMPYYGCGFWTCRNCGGSEIIMPFGERKSGYDVCKGCGDDGGSCVECRYVVDNGSYYTCSHPSYKL